MTSESAPVGAAELGQLIRVHRLRPPISAGAWVAIGIGTGLVALAGWVVGGWGGALLLFTVCVVLVAVGFAGYTVLAPARDRYGRSTIAVYDRGLLIEQRSIPPVPVLWSNLTLPPPAPNDWPGAGPFVRYPRGDGGEATHRLGGYFAERQLLRAVRAGIDGGPLPTPAPAWRIRAIGGASAVIVAVLLVVSIQAWSRPVPPPTAQQLGEMCEQPGTPHPGAAPYTGAGPHLIAVDYTASNDYGPDTPRSGPPVDEAFPAGWVGKPADAQLLVCVVQLPDVEIANCGDYALPNSNNVFGRVTSVRAYGRSYQMRVYAIATGRQVLFASVKRQTAFTCPKTISAQRDDVRLDARDLLHEPVAADFVTAIEDVVTGPARATG